MASEPPDPLDPFDPTLHALERPPPPVSWRDRIEQVADATGTTPARMAIGAVVAAVGLAGAAWLLRPPAEPVEASLPFTSTSITSIPSTSSTAPELLVVDVAGAVVAPGVHELPAGARVVDAIAAAAGLAPEADAARINLAAPLSDGERVYVPRVGEQPPPVVVGGGTPDAGAEGAGAGPVDLNTADEGALEALPGIGPATAAAIVQHRAEVGRFSSVDQLLDVPGIGEAKLAALRDLVTV